MAGPIREDQIYDAAIQVFARYGFKRARMEDIAYELDVVAGTLYRYCKGKKDLYEKAVGFGIQRWQAKVKADVASAPDAVTGFVLMCEKGHEYLSKDENLRQLLQEDPSLFPLSPRKMRFPKIDTGSLDLIRSILEEGIREGAFRKVDVEDTAAFLYTIYVTFIIKTYVKSEGEISSRVYARGIDLILNGLMRPDKR